MIPICYFGTMKNLNLKNYRADLKTPFLNLLCNTELIFKFKNTLSKPLNHVKAQYSNSKQRNIEQWKKILMLLN